jgi:hypothetical protein
MSESQLQTVDFPITYSSLNINDAKSTAGVLDKTKDKSQIRVTRFDHSRLQYRDQREGLHLLSGGDLGSATRVFRYLSLIGEIRDTTPALLADRKSKLLRAFDLEESQYTSPTTVGQQALDFYTPTATPPSGFTSPVRELYLCRPSVYPQTYDAINQGLQESWAVELICADPTRYMYTANTSTANSGNSFSIAVANWTATVGAMTWPVIRLNLGSGAHVSGVNLRFTPTSYGSAQNLTLDLSPATFNGSHTIDIDMRTKQIILDGAIDALTRVITGGTHVAYVRTSAVDTFWGIPANGGTFAATAGMTNITSAVMTYRQARA